jgi:hypothetical protein
VIETAFGDCGVDFQAGETYLVYADGDEGSGTFSTGSCTRTRAWPTPARTWLTSLYNEGDSRTYGYSTNT